MATTTGANRPATDVTSATFVSGNTKGNATQLAQWVRSQELKRDQLISFTSNETDIEDGDNVLTIVYRKNSIGVDRTPVDTIDYFSFDNLAPWATNFNKVQNYCHNGHSANVLSVTRTPKNIGNARCQTIWFTGVSTDSSHNTSQISKNDGNWQALANDTCEWLNKYIAPHQLVSVTFHEEAHPNQDGKIKAIVTHKAGAQPVALANTVAGGSLPSDSMYKVQLFQQDDTEAAVNAGVNAINMKGGQEGHVLTTANDSQSQQIICAVFSWDAILEDNVKESLRPTGCAGCTIF